MPKGTVEKVVKHKIKRGNEEGELTILFFDNGVVKIEVRSTENPDRYREMWLSGNSAKLVSQEIQFYNSTKNVFER